MPWYKTGTVAITAGQTTVTGTGTNFSANARVGDALLGPDGNWYEVTNIASATVLSILPAYKGATVSGGTYAITPVQGYPKTLADKFNDIANQWGSTLAGLGSVSTENVVPVTKGGTGGTTQATARNGLGLKSAAVADIVGTVSQSGGVPTGAIIERGSNANGEYVKYADGTLIVNMRVTWEANIVAPVAYPLPINFAANPSCTANLVGVASGTSAASYVTECAASVSTVTLKVLIHTQTSIIAVSANSTVSVQLIGRWY